MRDATAELIRTVEVLAGILDLAVQRGVIREGDQARFTGEWERLGTWTVGEALNKADAVIKAARQEVDHGN